MQRQLTLDVNSAHRAAVVAQVKMFESMKSTNEPTASVASAFVGRPF
jgi:hypothetical protein